MVLKKPKGKGVCFLIKMAHFKTKLKIDTKKKVVSKTFKKQPQLKIKLGKMEEKKESILNQENLFFKG